MITSLPSSSSKPDLNGLINAIAQATAEDSLSNPLTAAQWEVLAVYLQPMVLPPGKVLFAQGASERALYFVESGSLSVHFEDEKERVRLAIVTAGSIVGEGAFFSHRPRSATVQATSASRLWSLPAMRFTELCNRQPAVALQIAMAAGAVISRRMLNRRRRIATT